MEKYIPCKWEAKEAGVAILISDKIDLKIKKITRVKEEHYIMIKGSIQDKDITITNIYALNIISTSIHKTNTFSKKKVDMPREHFMQ